VQRGAVLGHRSHGLSEPIDFEKKVNNNLIKENTKAKRIST
jgi:hypothetical protein